MNRMNKNMKYRSVWLVVLV